MNKYEYIYLLKINLSNYEGNIDEIVQNYENIIDEMLDEGLTMEEIIRRLGTPEVLSAEIVEELELNYTQEYRSQTTVPNWTKVLLLICGVVLFFPLSGVILGIIGTVIGMFFASISTIIAGIIASFAIWVVPGIPFILKLLLTITTLSACIAIGIILYFAAYACFKLVIWLIQRLRNLFTNGRGVL